MLRIRNLVVFATLTAVVLGCQKKKKSDEPVGPSNDDKVAEVKKKTDGAPGSTVPTAPAISGKKPEGKTVVVPKPDQTQKIQNGIKNVAQQGDPAQIAQILKLIAQQTTPNNQQDVMKNLIQQVPSISPQQQEGAQSLVGFLGGNDQQVQDYTINTINETLQVFQGSNGQQQQE